jgi:hypothetical protein
MLTATTFLYKRPCNPTALQQGDIDALTCYCYRYLKPLTRYAAYITKNEIAAPDLANASLEQLWNKRLGMVDERTVHRFLCKNIRTICNQWLYEQLIIQGYLSMPDGWQPKYSKMEKPHRLIPRSTPPTDPDP